MSRFGQFFRLGFTKVRKVYELSRIMIISEHKLKKTQKIRFETDFTLTPICRKGIINPWHYPNLAGAKL